MSKAAVAEAHWARLAEFIVEKTGLHFPGNRQKDLKRGFRQAARELGFADETRGILQLLSQPPQDAHIQVLVRHLTIGETYLFRDPPTLNVLETQILPALITARRNRQRLLRVWSAACCTGEEVYMLAIMLHRLLPDLRDWEVVLVGTDINQDFLEKARAGVFSDWSFRGAPDWLKGYFNRQSNGLQAVVPEIRRMVQFSHLNLLDLDGQSAAPHLREMDLIMCRNVLMYLNPAHAQRVVSSLHLRLSDGGWIVPSPSEASRDLFPRFKLANFRDTILFQKAQVQESAQPDLPSVPKEPSLPRLTGLPGLPGLPGRPKVPKVPSVPKLGSVSLGGMVARPLESPKREGKLPAAPAPDSLEWVRHLADQGRFDEALTSCDRFLEKNKLSTAGHFIRAAVLAEQGNHAAARGALRDALFLDRRFVMAHVALGNLARAEGNVTEAAKSYANAQRLLRQYAPEDPLPESGLPAGQLASALASLSAGRGA